MIRRLLSAPSRLYYGWRIVALGAIANAVGGGIYQYGFAIFFLPISKDLNLSRASTSLVFSLSRAEGAFEGPVAGWLVDRFGPRYVLLVGALMTGVGYLLLAQVDSFPAFVLVYLAGISLGYNGGFAHTVLTAINSWFIRRRGLAMSLTISAHSLGGAVLAPLLSFLVVEFGWRTTSVIAGLAIWAFVIPAALGLKRSPESMGLAPDGDPAPAPLDGRPALADADFTLRQALRTPSYWVLALATTLRLSVINVISVHFIPLMVWKGTSEPTGALLLGVMSFLSVPCRIFLGWAGDRAPKNLVLALGMLLGVISFFLLQMAQELWHLWVFVLVFAVVESVNPLNWALVGDFYGRRNFATLRGLMGLVYTWGTALAPVLAGAAFDRWESYGLVVWGLALSYAVGAVVFALLRPPQPRRPLPTPPAADRAPLSASAGEHHA
ncbi:MAG: MFS transporter [Chloroflexi bacterium]|nr:MFS transporter [Chloroflexota bacterium]